MVIQHNLPAINSHRNLGINNSATAKNLEKLSSGYRINRAGDDAAGLAISEKMRGQIRGLAMAETNAANGISLIQTGEGSLNETHAILQRMRELAVQSSNGTYQDEDREQIAKEATALKSEIDRIASSTHYNGIKLLDGTMGGKQITTADAAHAAENLKVVTDVGGVAAKVNIAYSGSLLNNTATATLIVQDGAKSSATAGKGLSLIVGDKTYLQVSDGATNNTFADEDGNVVATMTDDAAFVTGKAGVISGLQNGQLAETTVGVAGGSTASQLVFQIGANGGADQKVGLHVANMSTSALGSFATTTKNPTGTVAGISVKTREDANDAIKVLDAATSMVSGQRAELGALQNRLEHTLNNLGVTKENLTAAESSIRDVDMAKEMMEFTKNNILVQASQAMLAQANSLPQGVLSLLR